MLLKSLLIFLEVAYVNCIKRIYDDEVVWGSAVSSPVGSGAKPQPTNDLVHTGVKECSSGGSSFC